MYVLCLCIICMYFGLYVDYYVYVLRIMYFGLCIMVYVIRFVYYKCML